MRLNFPHIVDCYVMQSAFICLSVQISMRSLLRRLQNKRRAGLTGKHGAHVRRPSDWQGGPTVVLQKKFDSLIRCISVTIGQIQFA